MSIETLVEFEDNWITDVGAWFPGERVVCRGEDLLNKFRGKRWMELFLFGITGREFDEDAVLLFEQIWVLSSSFPEPRLWNNRIAALSGSAKSTPSLGVAAGMAATDAKIYGVSSVVRALEFLAGMVDSEKSHSEINQEVFRRIKHDRVIPGYGRPITSVDERIIPLMSSAKELGFSDGRHVRLAFEVDRILAGSRYKMRMNIAALVSALAADLGLSSRELQCWATLGFNAGIVFSYIDGVSKKEGAFFPLRCERISYQGASLRKWEKPK